MHDTAFKIGCLAMDIYSNGKASKILEIGSLNVNGSLRDHAAESTHYVGVDIEDGPGVDVVVTPGSPLPFEDDSFDLVMASSVFEHDPAFWRTFVEMCRTTRKGGYIYINAPSNGTFHRYPEDHWRFYPDSGMALARWGQSQGFDLTLVESFVADRSAEVYNDFAAVFRKGPTRKALTKTFIYQQMMCYNARTWQSDELIHPRDATEDMVLIARGEEEARALRNDIASRDEQIGDLQQKLAESQTKAQETWTDRCVIEQMLRGAEQKALQLEHRASEARRKQDKFEALWESAKQEVAALKHNLSEAERRSATAAKDQKAETETLKARVASLEAELGGLRQQLQETQMQLRDSQNHAKLAEAELSAMANNLVAAESVGTQARQHASELASQVEWLRSACQAVLPLHPRWSWPSAQTMRTKRDSILSQKQIFDAQGYLGRNPDVAATTVDPLLHFVLHGMNEGRSPK